jgi:septum formation protein
MNIRRSKTGVFGKGLVLASTSPYKKAQMDRLGIEYVTHAPEYQEQGVPEVPAHELVVIQAAGKAHSLAGVYPNHLIIATDQVAVTEGRILLKPGSVSAAVDQLCALSGKSHQLLTGLAVFAPALNRKERSLDICVLTMKAISRKTAQRYVALDDPVDCAGAYKFERRGVALFERVDAQDPTAIQGLPLLRLSGLLNRFGVDVFDPLLGCDVENGGQMNGAALFKT